MNTLHNLALAAITTVGALSVSGSAGAVTTTFFDPSQTAILEVSGATFDTLSSNGYLFTYTLDKLFTGGTGTVIGRTQLVQWPDGLHAQAVTTQPVPTDPVGPAQITISRVDGNVFDLNALTFKLLGNTWATGAELEIAPVLGGNDGPHVFLDATGVYNQTFSYGTTLPDWRGFNTSTLTGYDTYTLSLFTDFALTGITLVDASAAPIPEPEIYAMMIAGLGLVGGIARRRNQ